MSRKMGAVVVDPGRFFTGTPLKVEGTELRHSKFKDWRFWISWSLENATVLALEIRPLHEDAPAASGITTTRMLRVFPLEEMLRAARQAFVAHVDAAKVLGFVTIDGEGGLMSGPELTATLQPARQRASKQRGVRPGRRRLTDHALATEMANYALAVAEGESVADFLASNGLALTTFENHRREAVRRGLFVGFGKRGKPGGTLTELGSRVIREGD